MDVKLSAEQEELARSVRGLLQRHRCVGAGTGPVRADLGAYQALDSAGYTDVLAGGGSAVDAVLVIEEAAALAPGAPVAARVLVGPLLTSQDLPPVLALAERPSGSIVRFAQQADAFLVLAGDEALAGRPGGCGDRAARVALGLPGRPGDDLGWRRRSARAAARRC